MTPSKFLAALCGQPLADLQVAGLVYQAEKRLRFTPFFEQVFVVLGSGLLELRALDQGEALRLRWVDAIQPDLKLDPGDQLATSSIGPVIFRDIHADSPIQSIQVFSARIESDGLHCEALQLILSNRQVLFFDPTYTFGIRVGGPEQEAIWRENRFHERPEQPLVVTR